MSILKAIDGILGSDFSGSKAAGAIDKATGQANAANQAAMQIIQQYGDKAMNIYKDYMQKGLDESTAVEQAAMDVIQKYGGTAKQDLLNYYQQAKEAAAPYEQAGVSLLDAIPALKAAMGLGGEYNVENSPMYEWQRGQLDEALTAQMNAMGQSGSPAAALIRSKGIGQLGASEAERQMANLFAAAQMGLGATQNLGNREMAMGQNMAGLTTGMGGSIVDILNQQAANRSNIYSNAGANLGQTTLGIGGNLAQGRIGMGTNLMNAGISKAQIPNGMNQLINTAVQLYGMGAFGGGSAAAAPVAKTNNVSNFSFSNVPRQYGLNR